MTRAALASPPAGLVTDLDGTIAPIVRDPTAARPIPAALDALDELARRLAVVAVITGRAAAMARSMLGVLGDQLLVVGNHGLEWWEPGADAPQWDGEMEPLRAAVSAAIARVPEKDGVSVESKGLSATVHYRGAPDPASARSKIRASIGEVAGLGLELHEGRMSIEVRPAGRGDKGRALRAISERFGLRGLVVAGDDVTDLDMFRDARELGSRGVRVAVVGVAGGDEVPAEVSSGVDVLLPDPEAFAMLLAQLAG